MKCSLNNSTSATYGTPNSTLLLIFLFLTSLSLAQTNDQLLIEDVGVRGDVTRSTAASKLKVKQLRSSWKEAEKQFRREMMAHLRNFPPAAVEAQRAIFLRNHFEERIQILEMRLELEDALFAQGKTVTVETPAREEMDEVYEALLSSSQDPSDLRYARAYRRAVLEILEIEESEGETGE